MADSRVTVKFDTKPLQRGAIAFGVAISAVWLSWLEPDPDINIAEIKAIEESVLGEPLSAYDVAEAVLEAAA